MGRMKDLLITIYGGGDEAVEAAQQIAGLSEIVPHDDEPVWISMKDREPRPGSSVLAYSEHYGDFRVVKWTGDRWQSDGESEDSWVYSQWTPLPAAPNSQTKPDR